MIITAGLHELPCVTLAELVDTFGQLRYLWCDLDGLHYGAPPSQAPGASHLWGWDGKHAVLARLEGTAIVAGCLVIRTGPVQVPVIVRDMVPWAKGERRVAAMPDELATLRLVTLEVPGPVELLADHRWAA